MKEFKGFLIGLGLLGITSGISASDKLSGTPMGSYIDNAYKAFDGNQNTFYQSLDAVSYAWVGLDLGEKYVITEVTWKQTASTTPDKYLLGVFQGANNSDFSDAVPIAIIDDSSKHNIEVSCSRGFRFVRYVGPAESRGKISELEFYGIKGKGDDSHLWQITNLPTVSINTVNGEIPYDKEHDISSTVIIISDNGSKVLEKSETNIRERGNASRTFPKKPWRIKFDKKQNVLDAPAKAKKWTLINNYGDKTLMRNMLAFDIARKMDMEWVPFCTPVDVVLNGEYKGCYQLCDQVEVNEGRLEIEEMTPEDISGDALTGGYFVEVDAYAYDEPVWFQTSHYGLPVTIKSPDEDEIVAAQKKYIADYFDMLEPLMKNTNPISGYRTVFDNRSFIQHMLVNEMAGNTDTYWSTYMYKRRNDPKIYTGPVWDFDLGFNNDNRTYPIQQKSPNKYLWDSGMGSAANGMIYFAERILTKDDSTKPEIFDVWKKARNSGLTEDWLLDKVDEYAELLDRSQRLNFMRWPILNEIVHQNPKTYGSYEGECKAVKDYIKARMGNLDKIIGYNYQTDGIEGVTTEPLQGETFYYNMTGLKVEKPSEPGIYIEVSPAGTRKIYVR